MIPEYRKKYNIDFAQENYNIILNRLDSIRKKVEFRVAETPVFVPKEFYNKIHEACESIVDVILQPNFKQLTHAAIPKNYTIQNEDHYPDFIAFDFGVCQNEKGDIEPQLIEMQAFPTMFAYQVFLSEFHEDIYHFDKKLSPYLSGLNKNEYVQLLKKIILGDAQPENVILLEIFPETQKTNVDFYCNEDLTGVRPVCITELIKKGKDLFYVREGVETKIERIYNRVIFDELQQQPPEIQEKAKILFEELNVTWVPHPNWFYRISKFTLPLIDSPYVPKTYYLNQLTEIPTDLENYVLKPLFSFAGQGVVIDVTPQDIENVKDPENWILQRKVNYVPIIQTPDEPAKTEIRIFYFWEKGAPRPIPTNSLSRLSKGKMIGVRFNKDKIWTGGSFCLFEQ